MQRLESFLRDFVVQNRGKEVGFSCQVWGSLHNQAWELVRDGVAIRNGALLWKWLWRFSKETRSLGQEPKIMVGMLTPRRNGLVSALGNPLARPFKFIKWMVEDKQELVVWKICGWEISFLLCLSWPNRLDVTHFYNSVLANDHPLNWTNNFAITWAIQSLILLKPHINIIPSLLSSCSPTFRRSFSKCYSNELVGVQTLREGKKLVLQSSCFLCFLNFSYF